MFNFFKRKVTLTKVHGKEKGLASYGVLYVITVKDGKDVHETVFMYRHLDWVWHFMQKKWTDLTLSFRDEFGEVLRTMKCPDWAVPKIRELLNDERRIWIPDVIHQPGLGPYGR